MHPLLFAIGAAALVGGKRRKRRPTTKPATFRVSQRAVDLAKEAGGVGEIGGVAKQMHSPTLIFSHFPKWVPGSSGRYDNPPDNQTLGISGDLETITVPDGWWVQAHRRFLELQEGDVYERAAKILSESLIDYTDEQKTQSEAFAELDKTLTERAIRWERKQKRSLSTSGLQAVEG
jgi:hypothetical protein